MRMPTHTRRIFAGLRLAAFLAAVYAVTGQAAVGQAAAAQRVTEPEFQQVPNTTPLAITVTPAPVPKGQMPEFVTMTLTNTSDHEVRFPQPAIGCNDWQNGTIELVVTPAVGHACGIADVMQSPMEKWMTLQPGDTANFGERITWLVPEGPGTFEVKAVYTPPFIGPVEQEQLYRESVSYPTEALTSAAVTLVREP